MKVLTDLIAVKKKVYKKLLQKENLIYKLLIISLKNSVFCFLMNNLKFCFSLFLLFHFINKSINPFMLSLTINYLAWIL